MAGDSFSFKQFTIKQGRSAFKVGTDGVILGSSADVSGARNVLDIGAGTGLIAIMLAQRCSARIIAIEPDAESYVDLVHNIESCRWKERIKAVNTALQHFDPGHKFDLLVSNPPYFSNSLRNPDPGKSRTRHNDTLPNRELLAGVSKLLEDNGKLQVIMPLNEGKALVSEGISYGLFLNEVIKIRPLTGSEVSRMILTFGKEKKPLKENSLAISTGKRNEFTDEYIQLTKEFYLKF